MSIIPRITKDIFEQAAASAAIVLETGYGLEAGDAAEAGGALAVLVLALVDCDAAVAAVAESLGIE